MITNRILLSLTLLLSTGALLRAANNTNPAEPKKTQYTSPYADKKPIEFMKDFLDVTKEPNKPFKYWVAGLLHMIKGKEQHYKQFLREFSPACKKRNANRIGYIFLKYKEKFDPAIIKLIKKMGLNKVNKALAFRVKKK